MDDYKRRIAANIQRERTRRGEKPIDVAYALGINTRTYERWEEGKATPRPANLKALADHWDIPIEQLHPDLAADEDRLTRIETDLTAIRQLLEALTPHVAAGEAAEQTLAHQDAEAAPTGQTPPAKAS